MVDRTIGVWMGELPGSLRKAQSIDIQSVVSDSGEASSSQMPIVSNSRKAMIFHSGAPSWTDTSASAGSLVGENMGMEMTSAQDIGSYQVYCAVSYIIIFMNINQIIKYTYFYNDRESYLSMRMDRSSSTLDGNNMLSCDSLINHFFT